MGEPYKINTNDFAGFLQSVVTIENLQQMTQEMDKELEDSQKVMEKIKAMYSSIPVLKTDPARTADGTENLSKLDIDLPNLLLPDMVENTMDVDVDDIIASMRNYAENLKKNIVVVEVQLEQKEFVPVDVEQYATSLDQLVKRLTNIKLGKKDEAKYRSPELEVKLSQLCEDVDMFNKMVQAKTTISESNKNWVDTQLENNTLKYDIIVNKLLAGINEVTYLLQNKK